MFTELIESVPIYGVFILFALAGIILYELGEQIGVPPPSEEPRNES